MCTPSDILMHIAAKREQLVEDARRYCNSKQDPGWPSHNHSTAPDKGDNWSRQWHAVDQAGPHQLALLRLKGLVPRLQQLQTPCDTV